VGVARRQREAAQALQRRVGQDTLHQEHAEPAAAVRLQHEHVRQVREGRAVGDGAREPDLPVVLEQPERERARDRALDRLARNAR
jgi:hypothetical protein